MRVNERAYIDCESKGVALKFILLVSAVLLLASCFDVQADIIKMTNGKFFVGSAVPNDENPDLMDIRLDRKDFGLLTVQKSQIANIEEVQVEELSVVDEEEFPEMVFTDSVGLEIKDKKAVNKYRQQEKINSEGRLFTAPEPDPVLPGETEVIQGAGSDAIRILIARVAHVKGDVQFKSPGGVWQPAEVGRRFNPGDRVRTGNGRARLFTGDKVELRLVENTEVVNVAGMTKPTLDLCQGRAWVKAYGEVLSDIEKIRIRTDDAIAGVTGSLLFVEKPLEKETTVVVFEGHVAVSERNAASEPLSLTSEEAVKVTSKGTERTRCDEKLLDEWTFWTVND